MKVSIGIAAKKLGVSQDTLRRWERLGKIVVERTVRGHRRYDISKLVEKRHPSTYLQQQTLAYARVSSHDQKQDLERQIQVLEHFCSVHGWSYEMIQDLGSGLNFQKRGLKKLIQNICSGKIDRLVLTHKDRVYCVLGLNLFLLYVNNLELKS